MKNDTKEEKEEQKAPAYSCANIICNNNNTAFSCNCKRYTAADIWNCRQYFEFGDAEYKTIQENFDRTRRDLESGKPKFHGPKEKEGKPDWSVFPFEEAELVLNVFEHGAKKYGAPFTYRNLVNPKDLFSAAIRHLIQIQNGAVIDDDSTCFHWAHVAANALMVLSHYRKVKN